VAGKGIQDLVGQVMIDKEFLADLVQDPARVLAGFDLTGDERIVVQHTLEKLVRERAGNGASAKLTNPVNIGIGVK